MKCEQFTTNHRPIIHVILTRRDLMTLLEALDPGYRVLIDDSHPEARLIVTMEEDTQADAPTWRGKANHVIPLTDR